MAFVTWSLFLQLLVLWLGSGIVSALAGAGAAALAAAKRGVGALGLCAVMILASLVSWAAGCGLVGALVVLILRFLGVHV